MSARGSVVLPGGLRCVRAGCTGLKSSLGLLGRGEVVCVTLYPSVPYGNLLYSRTPGETIYGLSVLTSVMVCGTGVETLQY